MKKVVTITERDRFDVDGKPNGWIDIVLLVDGEEKGYTDCWPEWKNDPEYEDQHERYISALINSLGKYAFRGCSEQEYEISPELFDIYNRHRWFIDGEDAFEYLSYIEATPYSIRFQTYCGIHHGWKFYKRLIAHDFQRSTAAEIAYMAGYVHGMEINAPWDREGSEALGLCNLEFISDPTKRDI